ncbi:hypothetical protein COCHEDRAFT_1205218 [Bipolaris maydis C5]|uniref:Receptor ligand binding region domain-containing protein n=1 Tax=Cochliobolus heterostrophus (strain C5 / ATCC 48332 / race O) TaxID=701091 RepID=M2TR27_COCH5|nr:hypothetical protein COCHEDRAFT_1205218 [Bipolaris maydis C5]KAJ6212360.1 hypothetical protein PSV09DRAFT_1205218 [Bipolaris maydis]
MHVRIVVTITSLLSLTVAQGNWNCKNLDDPTFRNDAYARAHNPYGLCVNDAGVGLLAHPCRSSNPCKVNNNGLQLLMPLQAVIHLMMANPKFEEENSILVLNTNNYSDADLFKTLLEENKVLAVILISNGPWGSVGELNLIEAAERSSTMKRFIPSLFSGLPFTDEHSKNPFLAAHVVGYKRITEALSKTSLEFAVIYLGDFMDYYLLLPIYVIVLLLKVSLTAEYAAIPGSGIFQVSFTYTSLTDKYVLLLLAKLREIWQKRYFIADDD